MERPSSLPLLLGIAVLSIATASIFIRLADDAAPIVIAAARLSISSALLLPFVIARGGVKTVSRRHMGRMILAGVFLAAHFFFWITSLRHTSVINSVVIVTTNPIFVGIASYFLFREPITRSMMVGIALAIGGMAFIGASDSGKESSSLYGDFMSLCGAVMASAYFLIGRSVRREIDTLHYILPVYGIAALLLLAGTFAMHEPFTGYRISTYVYFALLAIVPQLIGHSIFNWALRYMTATMIAICILGEPIGATILAAALLHEKIHLTQAIGGALILGGIYLSAQKSGSKSDNRGAFPVGEPRTLSEPPP